MGWVRDMVEVQSSFAAPITKHREIECRQSIIAFQEYFEYRLKDHSNLPATSILGVLASPESNLSLPEMLGLLSVLLRAGFETTANLLGNTLYLLISADVVKNIKDDVGLLDVVVVGGVATHRIPSAMGSSDCKAEY